MNARQYMLLEYADMQDGETRAGELCPACNGGASAEGTLSVSQREGIILWNCHRASCGFKGASSSSGTAQTGTTRLPKAREVLGRQIAREAGPLDAETKLLLRQKYSITGRHLAQHGLGWAEQEQRLCIPVRSFTGAERGVTLRSLSGQSPKTLTHTEQGALSWFTNHATPGVIIVEDQLSAIRASDYLTSVALLGVNLNDERAAEIKASGLRPVYLALDADAWELSLRLAIKYRSYLGIKLLRLSKDIKDIDNEELADWFASVGINRMHGTH